MDLHFKTWLESEHKEILIHGARAVIIPSEEWGPKKDATQYDADNHIIQIRSDYPWQQDPVGWIVHELVHYNAKTGWDGDEDHPYPFNPIERKAYTEQFKYLINKGYKTLEQIMQIPWIQHHDSPDDLKAFQQYFSDAFKQLDIKNQFDT